MKNFPFATAHSRLHGDCIVKKLLRRLPKELFFMSDELPAMYPPAYLPGSFILGNLSNSTL